jgi:hypothetical protein
MYVRDSLSTCLISRLVGEKICNYEAKIWFSEQFTFLLVTKRKNHKNRRKYSVEKNTNGVNKNHYVSNYLTAE